MTYTGGPAVNHVDGSSVSSAYVPDNTGEYGITGYIGCSWGAKTAPNGGYVAFSGDANADTVITAHFVWNPAYAGELPPKNAIVYQKASATFSQANTSGQGNCTSGLPHEVSAPLRRSYMGPIIGYTKTGYKYVVKVDPGQAFDVPCTTAAHLSGDGSVGPPIISGGGSVTVKYLASADAVSINTNSLHNNTSILIGQKFAAYLNTGQYPQVDNSHQWATPSYLEVFQSYHSGQLVRGSGEFQGQNIQFYWNVDGTYRIACTADVTTPSGETLRVMAERNIVVQVPYYYYASRTDESVYLKSDKVVSGNAPAPDDDPDTVRAGRNTNTTPGIFFQASVGTPDLYRDQGTGSFQFVQLVNVLKQGWYIYPAGYVIYTTAGEFRLDNQEIYQGPFNANAVEESPPDPNLPNPSYLRDTADSPEWGDISAWDRFNVEFEAEMYLMYLPPGTESMWVPLHKNKWKWNVNGARDLATTSGWSPANLPPPYKRK